MSYMERMLKPSDVESLIQDSLNEKRPFSLIRINDGENRMIGYEVFITKNQLPGWFRYTGVENPSEHVRLALIRAIRNADIVGLPSSDRLFVCRPLTEKNLNHYKLKPKRICEGMINRIFYKNGGLQRIVTDRRLLLVGLTIHSMASTLREMGAEIAGIIQVRGYNDIPRVLQEIKRSSEFDIALVAAGIPAKIISTRISQDFGKIAIDVGHLPEILTYPDKRYGEVMKIWLKKHPPMAGNRHVSFRRRTQKRK